MTCVKIREAASRFIEICARSIDRFNCAVVICVGIVFSTIAVAPAFAEVTRVLVKEAGPMGTFGGRQYAWANAAMEGVIHRDDGTVGRYRIPVSIMYPDRDTNGFAFVDVVNAADFAVYEDESAPFGKRKLYYTGDTFHSDYLRRAGFTYISVIWSRMVTDVLGADYGVIENGTDGWEIIKDAARFARSPNEVQGELPFELRAVTHVIGHGHSQTAAILKAFVSGGKNREKTGELVFDGVMAGGINDCRFLNDEDTPREGRGSKLPTFYETKPCEYPFPEDGKFILIQLQSELERSGRPSGAETPSFRRYELPGVSHIPPDLIMLGVMGATRQNPVSFRPVFKAMLRNLAEWIDAGREPPPPIYIEGDVDEDGKFQLATDADGNAKGGLRLPHMPTILSDGDEAGAPLGAYGGLDKDFFKPLNVYPWLGGTFAPFSPEELIRRYPTQEVYVDLVRRSAADLLSKRYILQEDYDAYVRGAELLSW